MENDKLKGRRNFVKFAALGSLFTMTGPAVLATITGKEGQGKIKLEKDNVVLFQGDSITDFSRDRGNTEPNNAAALGNGYAYLAAAALLQSHADKNLKIYNRGVSGNKVVDLANRWQADCLEIKPDVLSIFIGVNDYWHTILNNYKGTIKTYTDDFKKLLDHTKQTLPNVKLIIGEPFGVTGIKSVTAGWYPAFDEYRQNAKAIATAYGAVFIPCQQIFDAAQKEAPGVYWTYDGVHPTIAGCELMASAWLKAIQ